MVAKHKRLVWSPALLAALVVWALALPAHSHTRGGRAPRPEEARPVKPVKQRSAVHPPAHVAHGFEANIGQTDRRVRFLSRGNGRALLLTPEQAVVVLRGAGQSGSDSVVRIRPLGANPAASIAGIEPLPGRSSYFLGADPKRWITGVPSFARVAYRNVYPGVDLIYYVNDRQVEFDLHLAPGADPSLPVLSFEGAATSFAADGSLRLTLPQGELILRAPEIYQDIGGRRVAVSGGYVPRGRNRVGFRVGQYDRAKPLVIDPVLSYASYLGGSGADQATGVAVDASGNVYVAGETVSLDLPGAGSQPSGGKDIFVTKFGPGAATGPILYTAYLGGAADETAGGIAVDADGNVFVAGGTWSADFPVQSALQSSCRVDSGGQCTGDAFVAALGPDGTALLFASYLGGSGDDAARALALDATGIFYLTGRTDSTDFPVLGSLQPAAGAGDAFVAAIQPPAAGSAASLVFATYVGGGAEDQANAIAVAADGSVWVAGETHSADFPTRDALQPQCSLAASGACSGDAFVARISAPGAAAPAELAYSTFLGGSATDSALGLALDAAGDVLLAGGTESADFPLANPLQPAPGGGLDAFVARLKADGSALVYSTYLGGAGDDSASAAAVDALGNGFVVGTTASDDFSTKDPTQPQCAPDAASGQCSGDAFLAALDPAGGALLFSTYFGGSGTDAGGAVAVDAAGNAYITGSTTSADLPEVSSGVQPAPGGDVDAFVAAFEGVVASSRNQAAPDSAAPAITACTGTITITWNGSVSTQWNVAGNWTPAAVPVATDDVCIGPAFAGQTITVAVLAAANQSINSLITNANISFTSGPLAIASPSTFDSNLSVGGGTLTLNGATTITGTLTQSTGIITGTGALTVTGLFTWSGGTQSGAGSTTTNGGLTLTTTTHTLNARTLNTPTAVTWTAGRFDHGAGSVINNTGTWTQQADDDFLFTQGGARGVFNNTGTLTKSAGTLVSIVDVTFNNTGTGVVNANSGTLQLTGGGTSSAVWNVATALDFGTGTFDWNAGTTISGAGTLDLGATINVNTPLAIAPSVTQTGGTLTLNSATSLTGTFAQTSGTLTGASTLTVTGLFTWAGGTQSGSGVTTANGGLTLTTTTHTLNARTLNTPTAVTWTAGRIDHGQGSVINNTGTWTQQADDDFLFTQGGVRGVFNNAGTFTKSGGTLISVVDLTFNNTGTGVVNVSTGTLQFSIASASSAAWSVAAAATLDFSAGTHDWNAGTTITGAGLVDLGATINVNAPLAIAASVRQSGGTVTGAGTLDFNALFTWAGGTQTGGGTTNTPGGLALVTTTHTLNNRTLNTTTAVTWTAGRFDHGQGSVINNSGAWDLQSDDDFLFTLGGARGVFNNTGTFTKSGGTLVSIVDVTFNNTGTGVVNANSGTSQFSFASTSSAAWNVAATLDFSAGTHDWNAGTTISGAGAVDLGATINVNTAIAIAVPVRQTGGTVQGTGTLTFNALFTWAGGTQDGGGITNVNAGMSLITTTHTLRNRTLNTASAVTWTAGRLDHGQASVINNSSTWDLQSDDDILFTQGGTRGTFNNSGTFTKSGGTGLSSIDMVFSHLAAGVVNANSGTLEFDFDSFSAGDYNVTAILEFQAGTQTMGSGTLISGTGTTNTRTTVNFNSGSSVTTSLTVFSGATTFAAGSSFAGVLTISGGTCDFSTGGAVTLPTLTQTSGTLSGTDTVNVTGSFDWSGGTQSGSGTTNASGGWNLTGGVNLNTGRILNNVTVGVVSGSGLMNIGNGAVLNNLAGATFDLQNNGRLGGFIGGTHAINNQGTVTRSTSTGTFTIFSTFTNTGTLNVNTGTLSFSSSGLAASAITGPINVAGTLDFSAGIFDLNAGAAVSGAGTMISSATVNFNAGSSLTTTVNLTAGTLSLFTGAAITLPSLTQTSGTLSGDGPLDITGAFNWSGGTQDGAGITNANGGWNLTGGVNLNTGRTLNNAAAGVVSSNGLMNIGNGAVLNNLAGATLDLQNNGRLGGFIGGTHAINNQGTITRSTATGVFTFFSPLNNTGTVNVTSGTLSISNGGFTSTSSGAFNVSAAATLSFDNGTHDLTSASTISGAGTVVFSAVTVNVAGAYNVTGGTSSTGGATNLTGTVNNLGPLTVGNGTLNLNKSAPAGPLTVPTLTQTGGLLAGADTLNVTGTFNWSGGSQDGPGTTNANGGWNLTGGVNLNTGRTLNNAAAGVVNSNGLMNTGNGAVLNNLAGATLDLQNNGRLGGFIGGTHAINNQGTITRSTATGVFTFFSPLNNSGTVNVTSGTLSISSGGFTSTSSGAFNVSAGATLSFDNGTHDLNASAAVSGTGTLQVTSTVNFNSGTSLTTAVILNGGALALFTGSTITLPTLTQTSGSLTGDGVVNITGLFAWSGGSQDGAGITNANGGWNHTGGVNLNNGRTLNNAGAAVFSGFAFMSMGNGAVFNNLAGATLDLQGNGSIGGFIGGTHAVNNQGTITRSTSTGTFNFFTSLNNTGAVNVTTGTLGINNGGLPNSTSTGAFNVTGTLLINGSAHDLNAGATVSGTGTLEVSSSTVNFNSGSSLTTAVILNGGTLALLTGSTVTLPTLTQTGGTLTGNGVVNITGLFAWSGGSQEGAGITNANGGWSHTGGVNLNTGRTLNNAGAAVFSGFAFMSMGNGAVFNNLAGATLDLQSDQSIGGFIGGNHTFNNMGFLTKSGGTGTFTVYSTFNNSGTVNATSGTLSFNGNGVPAGISTGAFNVTTVLSFVGGTYDLNAGATVSGSGTTFISGGAVNLNAGSSISSPLNVQFGTITISTGSAVTLPTLTQSGGILGGTSTVNITGTFNWSGGTHDGTGITNANAGFNVTGGAVLNNGRTLNNPATSVVNGFGSISMGNSAVFNNLAGATLDLQSDTILGGFVGGTATVNNMGTMLKTGGAFSFNVYADFVNTGALESRSGSIGFNASFTQNSGVTRLNGGSFTSGSPMVIAGGLFEGSTGVSSIGGNINNSGGILSPGLSAGHLNLIGSYTQGSGAFFNVEIGGRVVGTQFDRLSTIGQATLAGTLNVTLIGGFTPVAGDSFAVLTYGARIGTFTTTNLPVLPGGLAWNVVYGFGAMVLQVQQATACTINFDNSAGSNLWQDSANWDTNVLPGPTDRVCIAASFFGVSLSSGAHSVDQVISDSPLFITGGSLTLLGTSGNSAVNAAFSMSGGTLDGAGTLAIADLFNWTGPSTQMGSGATIANGGASINGAVILRGRTLELPLSSALSGTINHGQGAVINVPAAANLILTGTASGFNFTEGGAITTLNNMGSLQKTAGGVSPMQLTFNNAGAVEVFAGTLNFSGAFTQSGATSLLRLQGGNVQVAGTLDIAGGRVDGIDAVAGPAIVGSVNNSGGTFAPGIGGPGTISITGNYTQGAGGALDTELGGNFAGGFDVLAVSGTASLNGTLNVIQLFGFVPPAGSTYNVITYASAAGDFATKNGLLIGGRLLTATRQAAFYQLLAVANADLSITNTDSPDPVGTGNTITYTMVVSNAGPDQALNATVTDTLPAAVTFVSSNTTLGSCTGTTTVTCNLGTLFNGSVATVTIQVQTTAPGSVSNTATVTSAATDAVPANDSATATTTVTTGVFLGPLPYTCQTDSPFFAGIMAGAVALETFEDGLFNVTGVAANTGGVIGPGGATDSVDCDDGVVDGSGQGGRSFFTGNGFTGITFTFNAAALGGFPTQVGIAWTDGGGTINFEAFDGAGNSLGRVSGNHADGSFSGTTGEDRFYGVINATGISAIHMDNTGGGLEVDHLQFGPIAGGATVDLSLAKADGPDPVNVGANLSYFLTVNNPGANLATGVVLTDVLPANVTFVSASPSQGSCSLAGSTVTCNMGGLAPSAVITATIVVTPGAGAVPSITNTATVAAAEADLNTANNSASATTTVNAVAVNVDLVLTKTDSPDPVNAGSNLTYTLTVTNNSATTNATSVQLSDTLPVGVAFVSATPTQGSCSQGGGTVSCSLGTINRTASATITIVVTPGAAAVPSITNVASVSSAETDTNPADNTASATTTVTAVNVDLALAKTDSPDPASVGSSLTYTLTVTNNGPNAATNVVLTDPLPATVALTSTTTSQGSCSQAAGTVTCNLGTINNGASATVTITVTPGPGAVPSVTNTATVAPAAGETDTNPANNSASAVTTVAGANVDLVLTKTDSPDPVNVGANVTYSLAVTNNGPDPATNTVLADTLPASVAFISVMPSQGTCTRTGVNVNCSLGTLAASATASVSIVVTTSAASAPSITNTATVTSAAVETNPADNLATATTTVNPLADLSVSKTDSPDPVGTNSTLVYTVTATNNGPSPATSVVISDTLPAGVTFVTASGSCTQAAGTVTCNVGTIASGASSPISISVTTGPAVGGLNNTAAVSSAVPDSNPNNNSITESTTVLTGPVVTVSTTNLVFASQPVGIASPPQAFAFNNTGNAPVTIVSIVAAGDFAQTSTCGASLAAGATCFVAVTFTPSGTGARNGSVTITHNAPGSPITVSLSGNGVLAPAISLTSVSLVFSTQLLNTTSGAQMVTLTNAGSATLNLASIVASGDFAQTNTCGNSVAVGANCIITITFTPTATGIRTGAITIISNAPGSSPVITLTGIGASPGVTISTSLLIFSGQGVGTTSGAQAVTLSNTSSSALTISGITISGDFAQSNTCGASLAAGVSCTISVTFTPTQAGPRAGLLTINDSGAGSPRIVSLSGTGLAATLTVAPNSLTFTSQPTGTTSGAQTVTVTNSGGVTVTITSITASGDFAQTNNCAASLAAAASCIINVTFAPTGNGLLTGTVSIVNSTPASPHVVNLLGTGVASGPAVALSVTQLTFAQQIVGAPPSPSQPVTLTNSGNAVLTINNITTAGDFAQTNNCGATLAASASCVISVTFSPATSGARAGSLNISSDGPGSPHAVNLSGTGVPSGPNAGLSASQLSFGTVGMGNTSASQAVTLTNSGNAVLNIVSIAASGDFAQTNNCGVSLAIGTGCTITITFTPTASGVRAGVITITDNAAGSPHTIALSGSGSNFTVTPASGSPNAVTVTAGQAAAFNLTLMPSGGFSESVNIACTGAPLGSACTATPGSVTLNTSVNITIAVTTIARRAETPPSLPRFQPPSAPALRTPFSPLWLLLVAMAMMSAALLASRGFGTRRRRHAFAAAAAIVLTVFLGSCAGGVGVPPPVGNGSGTAPGTYTLTITATSSSGLSRSTSLTLTVQ